MIEVSWNYDWVWKVYGPFAWIIIITIYPLTTRVVGAPQTISQPVFSIAFLDLVNSRLANFLMLSSHLLLCLPCLLPPFTVPCKMVLARPDEWETRPYHCSLHGYRNTANKMSFKNVCLSVPFSHSMCGFISQPRGEKLPTYSSKKIHHFSFWATAIKFHNFINISFLHVLTRNQICQWNNHCEKLPQSQRGESFTTLKSWVNFHCVRGVKIPLWK